MKLFDYRCADCNTWWVDLDYYKMDVRCPECGNCSYTAIWRSVVHKGDSDGWERTDAGWVQKEMVKNE